MQRRPKRASLFLWAALSAAWASAAPLSPPLAEPQQNLQCNRRVAHDRCSYRNIEVDGQLRHGIVCRPAGRAPKPAPLLLAFHGHGGCAFQMALSSRVHEVWPEALVVYPDGLTGTATPHDPVGRASGWQIYPGQQNDRDLRFVDALLAQLPAAEGADRARVYAMGHSNGSRFAAVLWAARGERFRAFAFSAAQPGDLLVRYADTMPARPVLLSMGRQDCLVPFSAALGCQTPVLRPENYQEASINAVRQKLGIAAGPTPATPSSETGSGGRELGLYIHDGGHRWPAGLTQFAVQFLRRN